MTDTKTKRGFTLIELLVVITIIGVLAGLAVPAISGALDKAKQAADQSNVRQLGIIFFGLANDEGGVYPIGAYAGTTARVQDGDTVALFGDMIEDGEITDPRILATNGTTVYKGSLSDTSGFAATNVGWDYLRGLTTTDNATIPLFVSKGAADAAGDLQGAGGTIDLSSATDHVWRDKGMVVYYVGNSAEWIKARAGEVPTPIQDDSVIPSGVTLITAPSS